MATFQLELVSPEKLLLSRQVEMALHPRRRGRDGRAARPCADDRRAARRRHPRAGERRRDRERSSSPAASPRSRPTRVHRARRRGDAGRAACPAPRPSGACATAEAALAEVTAEDTPERRDAGDGPRALRARHAGRGAGRPDPPARPRGGAVRRRRACAAPVLPPRRHRLPLPDVGAPRLNRRGRRAVEIRHASAPRMRRRPIAGRAPARQAREYGMKHWHIDAGGLGPLRSRRRSTRRSCRW